MENARGLKEHDEASGGQPAPVRANRLRVLAIFVSFLFIPAFVCGAVSLWVVIFGVTIAIFLQERLSALFIECNKVRQKDLELWYLKKQIPLVVLELTVVSFLPQSLVLFLKNHPFIESMSLFSLDHQVNILVANHFLENALVSIESFEARFVLADMLLFVTLLVCCFLIAAKKMSAVMGKYYYEDSPQFSRDDHRNLKGSYSFRGHICALLACIVPLFIYSSIAGSFEHGLPSFSSALLFSASIIFSAFFIFVLFIGVWVAMGKMSSRYKNRSAP